MQVEIKMDGRRYGQLRRWLVKNGFKQEKLDELDEKWLANPGEWQRTRPYTQEKQGQAS